MRLRKRKQYINYIGGIAAALLFVFFMIGFLGGKKEEGISGQQTESDLEGMSATEQETERWDTSGNIRVLLMTTGYGEIYHSSVSLAADSGLRIQTAESEEEWTEGILTLAPDDARFAEGNLRIEPLNPKEEIRVESIERGVGIPSYAGILEVWSGEEGMTLINELPLELYLCKVVPSEMPSSYEQEALKAQAVCARSYACRQMAAEAYPEYHANVNDSTDFQVYNNSYSAENTSQAVYDTVGQVVWYGENIAVTYYFSTSCGKTTTMEAWGTAPNEGNGYLQSIRVSSKEGDYEEELPWYQWRAEISSQVLAEHLEAYTGKSLGTLENVEVTERGPGDVALKLTASGTEGSVTVETENRIRTALGGNGYMIRKNDGSLVNSQSLLPSAFFTIECQGETYVIEGGGYGHGIGMSQNGANEMAKEGKTYKEILELFYPGTKVQ